MENKLARLFTILLALVGVLLLTRIFNIATAQSGLPPLDSNCSDGECVFGVSAINDDAGPNTLFSCDFSTTWDEVYFGRCANGGFMYSGFRFTNVTVAPSDGIIQAYLMFTVDGPYSAPITVTITGEDSADAPEFSASNPPEFRTRLSGVLTTWSIPSSDVWQWNTVRQSPDITAIIQAIVNKPNWASGNDLVILVDPAGTLPTGAYRRVFAFDRTPEQGGGIAGSARLVIRTGTRKTYLPLAMKNWRTPTATKSYYMTVGHQNFNPYALGQQSASEHQAALAGGEKLISILVWGQPCKVSSNPLVYGAYAFSGTCRALSSLEQPIKDFLDGYCTKQQSLNPGGSGQNCGFRYDTVSPPVTIALGVDNCAGGPGCLNPEDDPSNQVVAGHAQQWAAVVSNINTFQANRGYAYQIRIAGAMDIEGDWNTYNRTKQWLDAFVAAAPTFAFYNYGDCNAPESYNPINNDVIGSGIFPRDWSYDRIHYVSERASAGLNPLPQIYKTDGRNARQWQGLSKWATLNPTNNPNKYGKIVFQELLTQSNRTILQGAPCNSACNTPLDAINQVNTAFNADPATENALDIPSLKSTDILFYP